VCVCVDFLRKTGIVVRMLCRVLNWWGIDRDGECGIGGGKKGVNYVW